MRKHTSDTLQSSGASSATRLGTKGHQQKFITLDEVAYEAAVLLSASVPITIEEQIPVFTEWVESALKGNTELQKNNYSNRHWP
jgi:hypothetical protein